MAECVTKQLGKGAVALHLGSYATIKLGHSACPKSLLGMRGLLQLWLSLAPSGITNHNLFTEAFDRLGRQWPELSGTSKPLKTWVGATSQSVRIALAHVKKLAQQPTRFNQRTKGLTKEENTH
jgi:hypothetical protein